MPGNFWIRERTLTPIIHGRDLRKTPAEFEWNDSKDGALADGIDGNIKRLGVPVHQLDISSSNCPLGFF